MKQSFLVWVLMLAGLFYFSGIKAQPNGALFQQKYAEGVHHFSTLAYQKAGEAFAEACEAMPNHQASLMAARSFAAASDTARMIEYVSLTIELGRYRFNQNEFDPYQNLPAFQKLIAEAQIKLDWIAAENPEPGYYTPYEFDAEKSYPLVIYLHGHGSGPIMFEPGYLDACNSHGFIWTSVRGSEILGEDAFSWKGDESEAKTILSAIEKAKARYRIQANQIFVLGYDVGGMAAWKFQELYPGQVNGIGITEYEMPDPEMLARQKQKNVKIFVIPSENTDPAYTQNLEQVARYCKQQKIPFQTGKTNQFFQSLDEMLTWFFEK